MKPLLRAATVARVREHAASRATAKEHAASAARTRPAHSVSACAQIDLPEQAVLGEDHFGACGAGAGQEGSAAACRTSRMR
jgi:hypothetical protein